MRLRLMFPLVLLLLLVVGCSNDSPTVSTTADLHSLALVQRPEFVDTQAGGISTAHHFRRKLHGRDVDNAFPGRLQYAERMIPFTDHAADNRRLKLHHRLP